MAEEQKNVAEMTFTEASTELEKVVRSLEAGDLELEQSLEQYARGVELLSSLHTRLNEAQEKVNKLVVASDANA